MAIFQKILILAAIAGIIYFVYFQLKNKRKMSTTAWVVTLLVVLFLIGLLRDTPQQTEFPTTTTLPEDRAPKQVSVLKSEKTKMMGYNIHFLVNNPTEFTPELAKQVANYHCGSSCNSLYFWRTKKAFDLLMYQRTYFQELSRSTGVDAFKQEQKWERTDNHWINICEDLLGTCTFGEDLYTYPYAREIKYRELGGKMQFKD